MIIFQPRIYAWEQWLHRGVYFHGEIERLFGYDLAYTARKTQYLPIGKTSCLAQLGDDSYECFLYCWLCHHSAQHGLVVLQSDVNSNNYAEKAMNDKQIVI